MKNIKIIGVTYKNPKVNGYKRCRFVKINRKYSVLMSVYYKENPEWLRYSINSMLNQTIAPSDFVIVEDGKLTDELEKVVLSFEKKYPELFNVVRLEKNSGLGIALSIGITKCKYEYVARMDSDDYSYPNRIENQFKIIKKNPKLGLIGTNVNEFIDSIDNVISYVCLPEKQEQILKFSRTRCPFRHPSLLYKKSEVISAGNYHNFYLCEDYDLYVRMLKNGCQCYNIQEPLVCMRIGKDFYKRRGGIKYLKTMIKFKNQQLKDGYFSFGDYVKSSTAHIIVCLMPNFIREYIYKKILRKRRRKNT